MNLENLILLLFSYVIVFIGSREIALAEVELRRIQEMRKDSSPNEIPQQR